MVKLSILFVVSVTVGGLAEVAGRKHEERCKELQEEFKKKHPKASWKPHINPAFKGKSEGYFQRLLMRQGKMQPPDPSNLAKEQENLQQFKTRHNQNMVAEATALPEEYVSTEDNNLAAESFEAGQDQEQVSVLEKRRKKRTPNLYPPPTSFDYRSNSSCQSLADIRQQLCGDCWAVAAAAAFSDIKCLYTGRNVFFSAKQLVSCVYTNKDGCSGGLPLDAAIYVRDNGIMTGGDPSTGEPYGCVTYGNVDYGMSCPVRCDNGQTMTPVKAYQALHVTSGDLNTIQTYIFNYGPMVASFDVYADFEFADPAGVYQHYSGNFNGTHAIRVIGWGTQNGVRYWLLANSWGTGFGDNGYIKFLRGSNHCGIESSLTVMTPMEANISG